MYASPMMATSIRTLPAIVYRMNFTAAYTRRSYPQIPMRKYIGISIASQNM